MAKGEPISAWNTALKPKNKKKLYNYIFLRSSPVLNTLK